MDQVLSKYSVFGNQEKFADIFGAAERRSGNNMCKWSPKRQFHRAKGTQFCATLTFAQFIAFNVKHIKLSIVLQMLMCISSVSWALPVIKIK